MLRSAGYFQHALFITKASKQVQVCLDILMDDMVQYDEAVEFLQQLPRKEAAQAVQRHGKVLHTPWCLTLDAKAIALCNVCCIQSIHTVKYTLQHCVHCCCMVAPDNQSQVLITQRPEPTTALLMQLCTTDGSDDWAAPVSDMAHLFADRPHALLLLCEYILNSSATPANERALYHMLLYLYLDMYDTNQREKRG